MQDDGAVWAQVVRRDATAFERVYRDHFVRVRGFLRVYLGNTPAVEDVAQDTLLQLWRQPGGFDPTRSTLRAYLLGIARKRAAGWWRQQRPSAELPPDVAAASGGEAYLLHDALQRLEPNLRNVLWLREVEGYSYDELARILDIPVGTVRSRLFAAREQLRRIWRAAEE